MCEKKILKYKSVKVLMPEPDKSKHDGYIKNYQKTRKPKIIGIGREVTGLKKNGEKFQGNQDLDKKSFKLKNKINEFFVL